MIILLSATLGAVLAGVILYAPHVRDAITPAANAQSLSALQDGFVGLAAAVTPAVVNISTETATRAPSGTPSPGDLDKLFRENPWLRPFFKDFGGPGDDEGDNGGGNPQAPRGLERGHALGSGWIYDESGYIVTNAHVVRDATSITVQLHDQANDDKQYPAKLVGTDPKTELAVIKIDAGRKLPTLKLGNSAAAKVGQWLMAVGSPFALQQTVTVGVLSAKGRTLPGQNAYIRIGDVLQTDAAINPGNSGGPLVDLNGDVIGINVAIASPGMVAGNVGIGFAIPADTAKHVLPQLIKTHKVARGWLGINIEDLNENKRDFYGVPDGGVLIGGLTPGGPAAASKQLQEEDVVTAVNGEKVHSAWDLQKAVGDLPPDAEVRLDIIRAKKPYQVTVKLGALPEKYTGLAPEESQAPAPAAEQSLIGVTVKQITPDTKNAVRKSGVVVSQVDPNGPAAELQAGDVILKVNDTAIKTVDDFKTAVDAAKKSGKKYVILRIERRMDTGEVAPFVIDVTPNW
jgi:serine protease Do